MMKNVFTIPPPEGAELLGSFFKEVGRVHEVEKAATDALAEAFREKGPTYGQVFDLRIYDFKVTAVAVQSNPGNVLMYYLLTGTFAAVHYAQPRR